MQIGFRIEFEFRHQISLWLAAVKRIADLYIKQLYIHELVSISVPIPI